MYRLRQAVVVLVFCGCFITPLSAQEKFTAPLIPREVLFGNPERSNPEISPDGTQIGYLAPSDGVLNVWIRTLGKADDRVVTSDKHRGIRNFIWQYDNKHILYVQDVGGDENWRLYQTDIASKQTKDLTPFDKVRVDIVAYEWNSPDTILVQMNRRDPKLFDVHRIDLKTGKVELDTENPGDVQGWQADNALQVRAAQAQTDDGGTIVRVRDDSKAPWRELIKWGPDETFGGVNGFSPDNHALWVTTSLDVNAARLLEIDLASGKRKVITEDPQFDVNNTINNPKTNALEAVSYNKQRTEYVFVDPTLKADFEALQKVRSGDIAGISQSLDDNKWIVGFVSDDAPEYWYLYDRSKKQATLLFSNRPQLEKYKLSAMKPIEFTARDGMKLYGYLTTPALATFHKRMGDSEAILKEQSPLFKAEQIKAPLLIGQGANDPRVNKAESDQIVAAMRKNGKAVQYYVFPDEGHGFARPTNNMAFNAASEEFLAKYLGGRFEPPTAEENKLLQSIKQ